jgi:fumarylacetoacetase
MEPTLNSFASQGPAFCSAVRNSIIVLLSDPKSALFTDSEINRLSFVPAKQVAMHLPMQISGFTDFLCSEHHAKNVCALSIPLNPVH